MSLVERADYAVRYPEQPPPAAAPEAADPLSFSSLLAVLRRRWPIFLSILASTLLVAGGAALLLPRQYVAEASLIVDPRPRASVVTAASATSAPDVRLVETEVEFMESPALAEGVVRRLGLTRDPEFMGDGPPLDLQAATRELTSRVSFDRQGLTYLVKVKARAADPAKAALIANAMADEYLRQSRMRRAEIAAEQARTLTAELGPLGREVLAADEEVARMRAANGIVVTGPEGGTVTDQQIGTIAAELGRAVADAAAARSAAVAARSQANRTGVEAISQVANSDSLSELRRQRAQVLRERAQIATVYGPEHPAAKRIDEQLTSLDSQIRTAAERIVGGLESDARAAEARVAALRGKLAALEARQLSDSRANVVVDSLQRNADAKRSIYNDLSRNAQEQAQEARIGDVRAWKAVAATPPVDPAFPKTSVFLMVGLVVGCALGGGAAAAAELWERGYRRPEEVETELRTPFIAAVPELSPSDVRGKASLPGRSRRGEAPWDYVVARPNSAFAEALRGVRATLLDRGAGRSPRTICITSAVAGEGKSLTAISLARVMAMSGDRVLLIDCDLRRTGLARLRNQIAQEDRDATLVNVLRGEADPAAAVVDDVVEGVTLLGLRSPVFTAYDLFSGPRLRELLDRCSHDYDFVIVDSPPVLAVADAMTLSSACDRTLLVVRHGRTPREAVRAALERLRWNGAKLHGVVLNRRSRRAAAAETGYEPNAHDGYYVN